MRKAAYILLGLLGVLLVVDRVGDYVVTRMLDSRIESQLGQQVDTSIGGFPFLTQAVRGRWTSITVSAESAPVPGVEIRATDVRAEARGVRGYTAEDARAESANLRVVVPYADIERHADLAAGTLSGTEDGRVRAATTVELPGGKLPFSGTGTPEIADGYITVRDIGDITVASGSGQLSPEAREGVEDALRWQLPLDDLPDSLRVTGVRALPQGLEMTAEGRNVLLSDVLTG